MHNNWITGMDKKIYRQKEMHLFLFDENGYYSSTSRKYVKIIYESKSISEDERMIELGFFIAFKTNSIFILPQFLCSHCSTICKYCKTHKFCSFIELWKIRELNKLNKYIYRESVYFNILYTIDFLVTSISTY